MTPRQAVWNLHLENIELQHELKHARTRIRALERYPRCAYCGYPSPPGRRACNAHTDLLALDLDFAARTAPLKAVA